MTKQTQAHFSPEEKPTPELLLRRFKLMDDFVAGDYYPNIAVTYERIPKDPQAPDGPSIRVGKIITHMSMQSNQDLKHI